MNRFSRKQRRSASLSRVFGHKANDSTAHAKPTSGVDRRTVVMRGSALAATGLLSGLSNFAVAAQTAQPVPTRNPTVRRVVTGTDNQGRSHVMIDGNATQAFGNITQVWVTDRVPASNNGAEDKSIRPVRLQPPPNGVNFFFTAIAPEAELASITPEQREKNAAAAFEALGASDARVDTSRFVGMHKTRTVDYIILLSGELDLLLDNGEVHLKPFDVVVQRGTNHGWINRGTEPAIIASVLIDAEQVGR